MPANANRTQLAENVRLFVLRGFQPRYDQAQAGFSSHPLWHRMRDLGTELWLDTGSLDEAAALWTREFSALTTNNTLLNREVQTGRYDQLVTEAGRLLAAYDLSPQERRLELAFILNAYHGLRLVEKFDAHVSVEEHTDLAGDAEAALGYARRYAAVCPERFIVKMPLTPAGLLATRRATAEGLPVNHTLGFSARQNYVVARLARPAYVNVFLGRLNSFVADNHLGDGAFVGERATLASQRAVRLLRKNQGLPTRQIGASFRSGAQVRDLAGLDVMTIPPKSASEFLKLNLRPELLADQTARSYTPQLAAGVDPREVRLDTLWEVGRTLVDCVDRLLKEDLDDWTAELLVDFFHAHGCGDLFPRWTAEQNAISQAEGKIPQLGHWREALRSGFVGLDALMNLAGLNSFIADQKAMDDRVGKLLP